LSLLPRGEEYFMTMPYAHCKGILMGTMTVELGGKVTIECTKTGYSTEIEFKLRVRFAILRFPILRFFGSISKLFHREPTQYFRPYPKK
jgi:hypothetical protein